MEQDRCVRRLKKKVDLFCYEEMIKKCYSSVNYRHKKCNLRLIQVPAYPEVGKRSCEDVVLLKGYHLLLRLVYLHRQLTTDHV